MKNLWVYMKRYRRDCVLAPLFKVLEVCFELLVPLIMASVIDTGIANGDTGYIWSRGGILVLLGALGLASTLVAQFFSARAACGFAKDVRSSLFAHIGTLSYADLDRIGTSRLITSMTSDINQVQSGVNLTLRLLLRSPLIVFGAMIMAFTIDASAAVPFVVVIPLLSAVVFGIMLSTIPLYKKVQGALDRVLGRTRENLAGVRVIRAFCHEEKETAIFRRENEALTKAQKFVGRISALMNPLTYAIVNLGVAFLIWRSAFRVDAGTLTQGQVIALWNYMTQILVELVKLANLIITMTKSVACGNRIGAILAVKPTQTYPEAEPVCPADAPAVVFDRVSFRYAEGGAPALEDISFRVSRGMSVGVIGGTGSGKTTLVNLIPRLYDATEGQVLVDGCDVLAYPKDSLLHKVGLVPQKAVLFSGSIRDNLRFGAPEATDEECLSAVRKAQAADVLAAKEGGLDHVLEQGGKNLSGGQKQRLTIARALVRDPEILILDDSSSALDYATDKALRHALREEKCTVFTVSQRISSIRFADMILVLDEGRLVGKGTHEELMQNCEVYREIYASQNKKEDEGGREE